MSSIRSRDTQPELTVRRYLHRLGFRYRLSPRSLPGRPDLVMRKHGVVVFVHGCFWHGHAGCRFATVPATRTEFWTGKIAANRARDDAKSAQLMASGWRVAVVWECALRATPYTALQQLVTFIRSRQPTVEIAD